MLFISYLVYGILLQWPKKTQDTHLTKDATSNELKVTKLVSGSAGMPVSASGPLIQISM